MDNIDDAIANLLLRYSVKAFPLVDSGGLLFYNENNYTAKERRLHGKIYQHTADEPRSGDQLFRDPPAFVPGGV